MLEQWNIQNHHATELVISFDRWCDRVAFFWNCWLIFVWLAERTTACGPCYCFWIRLFLVLLKRAGAMVVTIYQLFGMPMMMMDAAALVMA